MAIFIQWTEKVQEFSHRRYIGNGEDVAVFNTVTKTRRARYSNDVTDKMIQRANDYIATDRQNARVIIE